MDLITTLLNKNLHLIDDNKEIDFERIIIKYNNKTKKWTFQVEIQNLWHSIIFDRKTQITLEE